MDSSTSNGKGRRAARTRIQRAAMLVGGVFLLVGVAGFIPGITSNFDDLTVAGHESEAMLLGIFQVSILHNLVHLLFGVLGVLAARKWSASRRYLIWGGVIYLALWVYGLMIDKESSANVVPVNSADDWLHLVLGIAMLGLGLALGRRQAGPVGHDGQYAQSTGERRTR